MKKLLMYIITWYALAASFAGHSLSAHSLLKYTALGVFGSASVALVASDSLLYKKKYNPLEQAFTSDRCRYSIVSKQLSSEEPAVFTTELYRHTRIGTLWPPLRYILGRLPSKTAHYTNLASDLEWRPEKAAHINYRLKSDQKETALEINEVHHDGRFAQGASLDGLFLGNLDLKIGAGYATCLQCMIHASLEEQKKLSADQKISSIKFSSKHNVANKIPKTLKDFSYQSRDGNFSIPEARFFCKRRGSQETLWNGYFY
jgi:hypothetical protein